MPAPGVGSDAAVGQEVLATVSALLEELGGRPDGRPIALGDTIEDIFTPFVSTKRRGTGLGLSVSRRIVEEHGGRITAESPLGEGATFRVCLPLNAVGHREHGG